MAAKKEKNVMMHLVAGGAAGLVESSCWYDLRAMLSRSQYVRKSRLLGSNTLLNSHPLDTIKTRMQLRSKTGLKLGPLSTARRIVKNEGFGALYKGLSAVMVGIVPKMAVRFSSFEYYKGVLRTADGQLPQQRVFLAGLGAGVTEAVLVVTPAEVCKIRLQAQYHSTLDPAQVAHRKYKNVIQTAFLVVKEEGPSALYKGLLPTTLRQGCNQAVNFTAYQYGKTQLLNYQKVTELPSWQALVLGGVSGGLGPMVNNPLDVCKTRLQKQSNLNGPPKYKGLMHALSTIVREEGLRALWKGLTPRLLRIMPGQAITFMTYEFVEQRLRQYNLFIMSTKATDSKL